jgi:hypothetical protein
LTSTVSLPYLSRRELLCVPVLALSLGCSSLSEPKPVADLIGQFATARKQPADSVFHVDDVTIGGITRRAIIARGPTRLTTHVTVPKHAELRTSIALEPGTWNRGGDGVLFLIGVFDGSSFQTRATLTLNPQADPDDRGWRDVSVDLEEFAGLTISIMLNTRAGANEGATADHDVAVWGTPVVVAR